jgi:hypothetical protein
MKKYILIFGVIILGSIGTSNAQTLGTKKSIVLTLTSYQCGDNCGIDFKDVSSGTIYSFDNIDEKTKDNGLLQKIQELYYKNGESDKKIVGNTYKAIIEYRKTNIMKQISEDEPPVKTGKQKTKWMINSISK